METILVIEDTFELRQNIAEVLILEGYNVFQAATGLEGIDNALANKPDLILCDIMMPGADGYEVLQTLKSRTGQMHIPFIYISALEDRKNIREGMELGADDYLVKPFTIEELLKAIRVRLDKQRSIDERITLRIEAIELELRTGISQLKEQVKSQSSLLDRAFADKEEMTFKLREKQEQLMHDALRSIEINNILHEMTVQLTHALNDKHLTEQQHRTMTDLRNRLRNRSILLNNQTVFLFKFEQTYPGFRHSLLRLFPKLKKQDLVLLATTYLHLDTNQLGNILNITPESVRKKRYRLKLKMGLTSEQELGDFIFLIN